ncbi:MAG: ABC transporter permease, partial [Burkholderiaceae bacterium]
MSARPMSRFKLRLAQVALLAALIGLWELGTNPAIPTFYFDDANQAAFFFGRPLEVWGRVWHWFASGEIYRHLGITLFETFMAFAIGTAGGLVLGLWLALNDTASAIFDPYIKALNSMPRVILAPIFAVWFGLGVWSKVALGVTLVFFIVCFNIYQGVREVSPTL